MKKKSFLRNAEDAGTIDYVRNGELFENVQATSIMVESSADLNSIEGLFPGSIAYTKGFSHMWQLGADGQWATII